MKPAVAGLFERIRAAGILDARHGRPLVDLLATPTETIVADGTSLEPLVRAAGEMVLGAGHMLVRGLHAACETNGARRAVIALKASDRTAIAAAQKAIRANPHARYQVEVRTVAPRYPLDPAEVVTGPALWLDLATVCMLGDAQQGNRSTHRAVTVTGAVVDPRTFWVPMGTSYAELIKAAGGPTTGNPHWLLVGGPLTGVLQSELDGEVEHTTHTLALLPVDHPIVRLLGMPLGRMRRRAQDSCHACERCTELCPVAAAGGPLRPHKLMRALHAPLDASATLLMGAMACTGCHLCTLQACPAELAPSRLILELAAAQAAAGHVVPAWTSSGEPLRLPLGRLVRRLGLTGLDHVAPLDPKRGVVVRRIARRLDPSHIPLVKDGEVVKKGQLLAKCGPETGLVPLYSGVAGVVRSLGDATIVIEGT